MAKSNSKGLIGQVKLVTEYFQKWMKFKFKKGGWSLDNKTTKYQLADSFATHVKIMKITCWRGKWVTDNPLIG